MTKEEYKSQLIDQLISSAAFLDDLRKKTAVSSPEYHKLLREISAARAELSKARMMDIPHA